MIWSSEYGFAEDAWEPPGEEGRGKLRKAGGRSRHPEIPGCPNGVIRAGRSRAPRGRTHRPRGGRRRGVNHLSTCRKRNQTRFPQ